MEVVLVPNVANAVIGIIMIMILMITLMMICVTVRHAVISMVVIICVIVKRLKETDDEKSIYFQQFCWTLYLTLTLLVRNQIKIFFKFDTRSITFRVK